MAEKSFLAIPDGISGGNIGLSDIQLLKYVLHYFFDPDSDSTSSQRSPPGDLQGANERVGFDFASIGVLLPQMLPPTIDDRGCRRLMTRLVDEHHACRSQTAGSCNAIWSRRLTSAGGEEHRRRDGGRERPQR